MVDASVKEKAKSFAELEDQVQWELKDSRNRTGWGEVPWIMSLDKHP